MNSLWLCKAKDGKPASAPPAGSRDRLQLASLAALGAELSHPWRAGGHEELLSIARPLLRLPPAFKLPQFSPQVKMLKGGLDSPPPPPSPLWPLRCT